MGRIGLSTLLEECGRDEAPWRAHRKHGAVRTSRTNASFILGGSRLAEVSVDRVAGYCHSHAIA